MTIATWNIEGMNQIMVETIRELKRRKTEILVVLETNKKSVTGNFI
jgi:exonuclease III